MASNCQYNNIPLSHTDPDAEIKHLGQAVGKFIQWLKKDIVIETRRSEPSCPVGIVSMFASPPKIATHSAPEHPATEPQQESQAMIPPPVRAPSAPEQLAIEPRQESCAMVPARPAKSVPARTTKKGAKGKAKQTYEDVPFMEVARRFVLGEPMLSREDLSSIGVICQRLHAHYMERSNAPGIQRENGIVVQFQADHFKYNLSFFTIDYEDLFDLFNLRELDASLMSCWTL